jgi:hypothetical protein
VSKVCGDLARIRSEQAHPYLSQGPAYCVRARFSKSQIRSRCLHAKAFVSFSPIPSGLPIHAPELGVGRSMVMYLPSEQPSLRLDICLYGSHPSPSPSTTIWSRFASGSRYAQRLWIEEFWRHAVYLPIK